MTGAHNDVLRRPKVTFTLFVAAVFHVSDLSMQKIEFHIPCDMTRYDLCSPIVCSLLCGCVLVSVCVCVYAVCIRNNNALSRVVSVVLLRPQIDCIDLILRIRNHDRATLAHPLCCID